MKLFVLLALLFLTACAGAPIKDGTYPLQPGQHVALSGNTTLTYDSFSDSRCPANARCVWAGRAVVQTRIDGPGWRDTTNMELGRPYLSHGVAVQLSWVEPGKMAGSQQAARPYLFGYTGG